MRWRIAQWLVVCGALVHVGCEDPYVRGELGKVEYAMFLLDECGIGCRRAPIAPFQELDYFVRGVDRDLTAESSDEDVVVIDDVVPRRENGEVVRLNISLTTQHEGDAHIELYDGDELYDVLRVTVRADGLQ